MYRMKEKKGKLKIMSDQIEGIKKESRLKIMLIEF